MFQYKLKLGPKGYVTSAKGVSVREGTYSKTTSMVRPSPRRSASPCSTFEAPSFAQTSNVTST
eukprot:1930406-Rhodomonas_salina.1